jgi:hypothetical protein
LQFFDAGSSEGVKIAEMFGEILGNTLADVGDAQPVE